MKAISIRLPDDTRQRWDKIADAHGLKITTAIRSFLIRAARRHEQLEDHGAPPLPTTQDSLVFDFLMAAEQPKQRED